ncbi:MAG: dihydrofolate reductase [Clostridiales bacterium]|nr:dihydrofolate reductase [Clostridiales bacterium]
MRAILHADREWGIGKNNGLMFRIPADMQFFKNTTIGNVVVMGSNTLKSFPGGKPLKDRLNIVLYPDGEDREDCLIVRSLEELFTEIKKHDPEKVFVVGGQMMYKTLLPYCTEVLVTKVDAIGGADAFFENLDENKNFVLSSESAPEVTNGYTIKFTVYKNLNPSKY